MNQEFWLSKWKNNTIGFHRGQPNELLLKHATWSTDGPCTILVPLCGKSVDLLWLAERGHSVVGVELSEMAAAAFFEEAGLSPTVQQKGAFQSYSHGPIEILCGDLFDFKTTDLTAIGGVYDRASLVALPENLRKKYASWLAAGLSANTELFLISVQYAVGARKGPPFSVAEQEVTALFEQSFVIKKLGTTPATDLKDCDEVCYRIVRR
ncbi:MAG: thiopurine S-methyltransferase [Polyangiaceae bacterium]|nr:thiopurine S-methyltransferase [Polyangiaceae bacterium]